MTSTKQAAKVELDALVKELGELQELLYAAGTDALLIVLQGMDTSGKDGTIRAALSDMNASGVHVWSFKVPTAEERAHDFLWRHHLHTPALSSVAVFNRSYYEAVLVELVKGIVTPEVAVSRYSHINDFELLLDQSRTVVVKFFLHISKEKQEERLLARQAEVEKWWKLSLEDWQERQRWDDYMAAYQAAINATATTGRLGTWSPPTASGTATWQSRKRWRRRCGPIGTTGLPPCASAARRSWPSSGTRDTPPRLRVAS